MCLFIYICIGKRGYINIYVRVLYIFEIRYKVLILIGRVE